MTDTPDHRAEATGRATLGDGDRRPWIGWARIGIGLVQGLALYALYRTAIGEPAVWPATWPSQYGPLLLVSAYAPVILLAGIGRMRPRTLIIWTAAAAAFLVLMAWHDVVRQSDLPTPPFLEPPLFPFAAAALFIAHHLIQPADRERRLLVAYPAYFDTAWKNGVQLAMSLAFTGVFWILLHLGSALFGIIGLRFLGDLISEPWFTIPVTCVVFAVAVQLADVRDGLIRGVRSVALMLLSWLLPVMTVLVAGFLAALPFTGMDGLWETGSATALVLAAAAALIVLINTAYQDGEADNLPPRALRLAVQLAAVLLAPLMIIAVWGLSLRIGQHGLTPDRIIAAACALVGIAYAGGYGFAAIQPLWRRGADWMQPLERTNVAAAVLAVATIIALFTPLADPARLSVGDQLRRLESGQVSPDRFDYAFLRFHSGRVGETALKRLAKADDPVIAGRAAAVLKAENAWDPGVQRPVVERAPTIEAAPGTTLPADFLAVVAEPDPRIACIEANPCVARLIDLNGDGEAEALLAARHSLNLFRRTDTGWSHVGAWPINACGRPPDLRDLLRRDALRPVAPEWPELELEGRRSTLFVDRPCPSAEAGR